ncbi:MAG: OmpA family protein [Candidatus Brocadiaceae bacterium]|nr:OmpA family protein [Candidatus Brocadiaceae bacterium]
MLKRLGAVAMAIGLIGLTGCAQLRELRNQNASLADQVASLQSERAVLLEENREVKSRADALQALLDKATREGQTMARELEGVRRAKEEAHQQALELKRLLAAMDGVDVDQRPEGNFVRFESDILFSPGRDELTPEATAALDRFMGYLRDHPEQMIRIDGHTDGVPISRSGWKDNYHLGAMRALSVMRYLIGIGLDPSRAFVAGFGPNEPRVAPHEPTADVPENRRVEVFLVPRKAAADAAERVGAFGG